MFPELNVVIGWQRKHHYRGLAISIHTKNGNAIESICELHYNYANYVNYANCLIGKNVSWN